MSDGITEGAMESGAGSAAANTSLAWRDIPGMIWLSIKIFFLRLITLGIYHFWGKTEVRRKLWSAVQLEGQPLEYTGKGKELFFGFLIVLFLVLLPMIVIIVAIQFLAMRTFGPQSPMVGLSVLPIYVIMFYLFGVAQYRARRYRLSRTNWRGIRGSMAGSPTVKGNATTLLLSYCSATAWTASATNTMK